MTCESAMTIGISKHKIRLWHRTCIAAAPIVGIALGIMAGIDLRHPESKPVLIDPTDSHNNLRNESITSPRKSLVYSEVDLRDLPAQINSALQERGPATRERALFLTRLGVRRADVPGALAVLITNYSPDVSSLKAYLAGEWVQSAPWSAFSWLQSLTEPSLRDECLRIVMAEWAITNSSEAIRSVNALNSADERDDALATIFDTLAAQNPEHAMELLKLSNRLTNQALECVVLKRWARTDPVGASDAAVKIEGLDPSIYIDVASRWVMKDPQSCLKWAETLPSLESRKSAFEGLVKAWAMCRPEEAADFIVGRFTPKERGHLIDLLFSQWAPVDPERALVWAGNLELGPERERATQQVFALWAQEHPEDAAKYALTLVSGQQQMPALGVAAAYWALQDPEDAVIWERSLPTAIRAQIANRTLEPLIRMDPASAANLISSLEPNDQAAFIQDVAAAWAQQDLSSSISWLKQLQSGAARDLALNGLLSEWATEDPLSVCDYLQKTLSAPDKDDVALGFASMWARSHAQEALRWAESLPEGSRRNMTLLGLVQGWASESPDQAAIYAAQIPDVSTRNAAVTGIAGSWAVSDPEAAANWVGTLPDATLRSAAIAKVAKSWAQQDAAAAVAWAQSLCDVNQIGSDLNWILRDWFDQDPPSARNWLQNAQLPEAIKSHWLRRAVR